MFNSEKNNHQEVNVLSYRNMTLTSIVCKVSSNYKHEWILNSKKLVLTESHEDKGSSNDNKGLDSICIHQRSQSSYRDIACHLQDILWASTNEIICP